MHERIPVLMGFLKCTLQLEPSLSRDKKVEMVKKDLQHVLEGMVTALFGKVKMRWVDEYFPFTEPSLELEIFYNVCGSHCLSAFFSQ